MSKWVKITEFGDYRQTPDRSRSCNVVHIIREARALSVAGKHAGSKPLRRLLKSIARAHEAITSYNKAKKEAEVDKTRKETKVES